MARAAPTVGGRRWPWVVGVVVLLLVVLLAVLAVSTSDDGGGDAAGGREDCARSAVGLARDAHAGRVAAVTTALGDGADAGEVDEHGNTPLACAVPVGSSEVVSALLAAGADPGTEDRFGDTVVADAVRFCHDDVLELLLDAGADPEEAGIDPTPLVQAVDLGSARAVGLLLAAGAEPDPTPVAEALRGDEEGARCPPRSASRRAEALAVVLEGGGDPDDVLDRAVHLGAWSAVPAALDAGADPDADQGPALADLGCSGSTTPPEDLPAECGPISGVLALVGESMGGTEASPPPTPALVHVSWAGDAAVVRALLDAGVDPDVVGPRGVTALAAAAGAGADAVVDLLLPVATRPLPAGAIVPSGVAGAAGHAALAERLRRASA